MKLDEKRHIIAVGDIHGCDFALLRLMFVLKQLPCRSVFLGDYLDRGPSSPNVIELLIEAQAARPDWLFLLGNHEDMFLSDIKECLEFFNKDKAGEQYRKLGGVPNDHMKFLQDLLPWWESKRFLFVHAGIEHDPHLPVENHELDELLWTYNVSKEWRGNTIVRGHQVVKRPKQHHNQIDLDTGCCFGGALTAGILDDANGRLIGFIQADNDGKLTKHTF